MKIPKTPIAFDYDLWTTEDGKCMVRVKRTGEVSEVDRKVMRILRAEEKRIRRSYGSDNTSEDEDGAEKISDTVLSLDAMPEDDVKSATWLADSRDCMEELITALKEKELLSILTEKQRVKIGITGGIGSGKSVVSRLLEVMGIPVYISDGETKQLMMTDSCIRSELTALLGEEVYAGGVLNKSLLASYLFGSPEHAGQINGIVHPRVKEDFRQWVCQRAACRMAGIESAILIEAGFADEVDVVVMVYAPEEIRVQRAMKRDASSRELIEKRIRSQMGDEEKRKLADFVIVNDGETPLIPQVLGLITFLSQNNTYLCPPKK